MVTRAIVSAIALVAVLAGGASRPPHRPIALRDLVSAGDPLAGQAPRFDARFAATALDYVRDGDLRLPDAPAAQYILNHARQFDDDVPRDSTAPPDDRMTRVRATPSAADDGTVNPGGSFSDISAYDPDRETVADRAGVRRRRREAGS